MSGTPASIYRTPDVSGLNGLKLQPATVLGSPVFDPDPMPHLTRDGWVTTRHGFIKAADFYSSPPAYGDAHPNFAGMGLVDGTFATRFNGSIIEMTLVYQAGAYGSTIGAAQQPSDEFSLRGTPATLSITEHPKFSNDLGGDSPWNRWWNYELGMFVGNDDDGPVPSYLVDVTTFIGGGCLLTCTQYFNSIPAAQPDLVGDILDPPTLNVWGTLPGDSTAIDFGFGGQWLCMDYELGLRGQWWFRRTGHQLNPAAISTDIYDVGTLS